VDAALLARVLGRINAAHGTELRLGGRFARGAQGAYRLRDATGAECVLKWQPGASRPGRIAAEVPLLDRLRAAGYPVPRYVAFGVLDDPVGRYTVQERLPGESAWGLSGPALEDALALNDLQAGAGAGLLAPSLPAGLEPYEPWHRRLPRLTLEGDEGFCRVDAMPAYSAAAAALLERVQEYVAGRARLLEARPGDDVVHFDFGGPNILVERGRVSGVVDWAPLPGDRAFDLATLLFYDGYYADVPATRARVRARALELIDAETFGVYLCHMVHREADWAVRHDDDATIARALAVCDAALADLDPRAGTG
jgi:hypothetical protein